MQGVNLVEVEAFLQQVGGLSLTDFEKVSQFGRLHLEMRDSGRPLIVMGAADDSWLIKRVGDVIHPFLVDPACSTRLGSGLSTWVETAVQAIVRRDRLSVEQYESFVGGFRSVGVVVPGHPSAE